jgi:hypothetical protein
VSLRSLTLTLTHASGPIGRRPVLNLTLTFSGAEGLPQFEAGLSVLDARGARQVPLRQEQFDALVRALEATGIEQRVPKVDGKIDTSDSSARLLMHVAHEKGSRLLDVDLLSSGYEGPDAPALQKFLGLLLDAAGVRDASIRHDLAGD